MVNLASGEIKNCDQLKISNLVDVLNEQFNSDLKINDRANSPENEEASSSLEARALAKWSCAACTYQNWPKSSKCIMCGKKDWHCYKNIFYFTIINKFIRDKRTSQNVSITR